MEKKPLAVVALAVIIIVGGVLGYFRLRASMTPEASFAAARKYFAEKKYPEAIVKLLNVLQKQGRNRDARYLLAMSYLNEGDIRASASQLNTLLESDPDDFAANLQLGGIYYSQGARNPSFFRLATERTARILLKSPDNVDALVLAGNALAGMQDYPAAINRLDRAVKVSREQAVPLVSLAFVQMRQGDLAEAGANFQKAVEHEPTNKLALISLANFYGATGKIPEAAATYQKALQAFPAERDVYLPAISFYRQTQRFADVEKTLKSAAEKAPGDPQPLLALADIYNQSDRHSDAQSLLTELKQKFPGNLDVAANLALSSMHDQPDVAQREINQILKADSNSPLGNTLLGELQYYTKDYKAAELTLAKGGVIDGRYPQAHFLLGDIARKKGNLYEAQGHFQKSLEADATYVPAHVGLAEMFMANGRLPDARTEVNKALALSSTYVPARLLNATLHVQEKKYGESDQEFSDLARDNPQNPVVFEKRGLYYQVRGSTAEAEKSFAHALELEPNSQPVLQDLVQFYISVKQPQRAIDKLNSIPDNMKQAYHYDLLGAAYTNAGKLPEAEQALKKALEKEPGRVDTNFYLAMIYDRTGKDDAALQALAAVLRGNPSHSGAYTFQGGIYEKQNKLDAAKQSYTAALKINPNAPLAANNLAFILLEEGRDLDAALDFAQRARKGDPNDPNFADTLGWVQHTRGNNTIAREQLRFAVSKNPDNPVFQYHLAMVYKQDYQMKEAEAALRKALSNPRNFKERSLAADALKQITLN
ncbi:MAG TPA: tetratricopeptide repeat protein [Terriglobia bacterium]|jgi:tetratricopeptide (TPR) repeat protein